MLQSSACAAATASSVRRDDEEIRLANLAARVAAAGRRFLATGSLDEHRDLPVLRSARDLLQAGAATLSHDIVPHSADVFQRESYALARLTHSALHTGPPERGVDTNRKHATAKELQQLADDVSVLLDPHAKPADVRSAADDVSKVFSRISSTVLREFARSGDSIGGASGSGATTL